ncbi:hypothetical protein [Nocardioides immobilis]|nr:hypothetical protein [Nocardioides immobilis]
MNGTLDDDDVSATLAQLRQIPLDHERFLNAIHPPRDAGEYANALIGIMKRIPDGWGRWIECDRGWFPLVTDLDSKLAGLCPEYTLHQVKEKYGTLRYYADPCGRHRHIDDDFEELIRQAEAQSAKICEDCGADGNHCRSGRWYRTLCSACIERHLKEGRGRYEPVAPRP